MPDSIRVLMVDDYPLLRAGIQQALGQTMDIEMIGFADHTAHTDTLCERLTPDVLIYSSKPVEPIQSSHIRALHKKFPDIKLLLLVSEEQSQDALALLTQGASGILLKGDPEPVLAVAIRTIFESGTWVSPNLLSADSPPPNASGFLTKREQQVLHLMARGWDNPTIAAELDLAEQTIRNYVSRLYEKLKLSSRSEAIVWALEQGFGKGNPIL